MAIGYSASLISPHRWDESFPQGGQFKRVLASSFLLHLVFFSLLLTIQVAPTLKENMSDYQVALVNLSDLTSQSPAVPQKTHATSPVSQESFHPSPERLSESFAGAVGTIAVPQERKVSRVLPKAQSPIPPIESAPMENGSQFSPAPPPSLPNLEVAHSTAPPDSVPLSLPKEDSFSRAVKDVVQSVPMLHPSNREAKPSSSTPVARSATPLESRTVSPKLPKAPPLAAIEPSMTQSTGEPEASDSTNITKSIQEMVQGIDVPNSMASAGAKVPSESQPSGIEKPIQLPNHKSVAESLREVMKSVVVPESRPKDSPMEIKGPATRKKEPVTRMAKPLTESLKEVLSKVVVPTINSTKKKPHTSDHLKSSVIPTTPGTSKSQNVLKDVILPPKAPDLTNLKLSPSPPQSAENRERNSKPSALNQQIAKLMVPDIQAPEKGPSLLETITAKTQGASTDLRVTGGTQEGNPYWGLVRRKVDQEWVAAPVEVHPGQPIQVIIGFRLQRTGHVQRITVEQSSGRSFFDLAGKRAVLAADPLPPFPADMKEAYYDLQFQFTVRKETP